jgi:thymidine phosphorylase
MFLPQELIRQKRDGHELPPDEIAQFVTALARDELSEGQAAAFAMAVYLNGMTRAEAVALTLAMRDSGEVLDWRGAGLNGPVVDKHSTGGVGDTVSLMLAPMLAACGAYVPMISGRGLGHTGGTLDKLDAIPGYKSTPDVATLKRVVRDVGCAIIGQTAALAPADKRLYAIRDTTATIESIPLIAASILSKKLAAGLDALVMDVKAGSGAFMPTRERSQALAQTIAEVGTGAGLPTQSIITDMSQPLASAAGNALEVQLAIDYLTQKRAEPRLHEVVLTLGAALLVLAGVKDSADFARAALQAVLDSGAAAERFGRMVAGLGGPVDLLELPGKYLARTPVERVVPSPCEGRIASVDVRAIGLAVVRLGGGRARPSDTIDYRVGATHFVELGQPVRVGDALARVHAASEAAADLAVKGISAAFVFEAA